MCQWSHFVPIKLIIFCWYCFVVFHLIKRDWEHWWWSRYIDTFISKGNLFPQPLSPNTQFTVIQSSLALILWHDRYCFPYSSNYSVHIQHLLTQRKHNYHFSMTHLREWYLGSVQHLISMALFLYICHELKSVKLLAIS